MKELFGYTQNGAEVYKITLKDKGGNSVALISYGACIQSLIINNTDVVLGYDTVGEYESQDACLGQVIGRCANRIGKACFSIDGTTYNLSVNSMGKNHIHGGFNGFSKKVWSFEEKENSVVFSCTANDGEEGYPGNIKASVCYTFKDQSLDISYDAVSDKKTLINLTNHSYFNLNGCGDIMNHTLCLKCSKVAWSDDESIPDGRLVDVAGTVFDFTNPKKIGKDFGSTDYLFVSKKGYDHNFIANAPMSFRNVGFLKSDDTNLRMDIWTDMDDVVVYTANYLSKRKGKKNTVLSEHSGICFETQYMTNAVNLEGFRKPVFNAGEHFSQHTRFVFS